MSISDRLIEDASANGWQRSEDDVLMHPTDAELSIRRDAESGNAILSPKLVRMIAVENWTDLED